jgi:hypothetical protein
VAVNPTPDTPQPRGAVSTNMYVLTARPDIIQANQNDFDRSTIATAFFESMAGTEILLTSRTDLVTGINVQYVPFSDMKTIVGEFDTKRLIVLPESSEQTFSSFAISFQSHVPQKGSGPNETYLYIDDATGDLVIEVDNVADNEEVEVEFFSNPTINADTVYNDIGE